MEAMKLTPEQKLEHDLNAKEERREKLIIDFDEAVREEKAEPVIVKFKGEEYELPANMPAWFALMRPEKTENGREVYSNKQNLELIRKLLGEEFAEKMMEENHASFKKVNDAILFPLMNHWGVSDVKDESKNTTAPGS